MAKKHPKHRAQRSSRNKRPQKGPVDRAPKSGRLGYPDEEDESELLITRWLASRSGARAGRGFHFQDAVGAWLAARIASGSGAASLVPEGFEDMSLEGDRPNHIQVKSRVEHLGGFSPSIASRHILDAWAGHDSRADHRSTLTVVLERGVTGEDVLNSLDDLDTPLANSLPPESVFMATLAAAAAKRGMSQPQVSEMLGATIVIGATWAEVEIATSAQLGSQWHVPPLALRLVARQLCSLVAEASDANATASYENRRRLDRTELVGTIEQVVAQVDLDSLEYAIRQGICESLEFPEAQPADDRYYEGTATQPLHVATGLVVPRPDLIDEVLSGLEDRSAVLITGPSGVGKSAVLWTVPLALPGVLWFRVRRLAVGDAHWLIRLARAYGVAHDRPVGFLVDAAGTADFTGLSELVTEATGLPGLLLIATARVEDLFMLGDLSTCASIEVRLDEAAAEMIFKGLLRRQATIASHWAEAYAASEGLTLEFTHMLTQGQRLREVVDEQVRRRVAERRGDELDVLALTSVADRWSATLTTAGLATACGLTDIDLRGALSRLAAEHLVVERDGEVGGLHRLRSVALCDAIHRLPPPDLKETIKRVTPLVPASQLSRFVASLLSDLPDTRDLVIEAELSTASDPERLVGLVQGVRIADFHERAKDWIEITDRHSVPASSQPFLFAMAAAGLDFPDIFPAELRAARDAMDMTVERGYRDELIATIGHDEVAAMVASQDSVDLAIRLLAVMDGSPAAVAAELQRALRNGSPFEQALRSASLDDLAECIAAARDCDMQLAAALVELLGGEAGLLETVRADNPWIIELDVHSEDQAVVGYCRFLHVSDSAQGDPREQAIALGRTMLRLLPRIDHVDVQALLPGGQQLTIGDHTHGISQLKRQYDHTPAGLGWNQTRLRAVMFLLGAPDTKRLSEALPLLNLAADLTKRLGNGLVSGKERDFDELNARVTELHDGGRSLPPPIGSAQLGEATVEEETSALATDHLSALITALAGNVFPRLSKPEGYRTLASYIGETVIEKHLKGALAEPWSLLGIDGHPPALDSLQSILDDLYAVINELAEVDADRAKIGRSARSGTQSSALERAAGTCKQAGRRRGQARRAKVESALRGAGLAATIHRIDREGVVKAEYLISIEVASLLEWADDVGSIETTLGADRQAGETYVLVPFRYGRPVPSLTTKLITNLWPYPNPKNLDALPAPHSSTLAELFDQCHHSLQALSGVSQLPDEQQSHQLVSDVVDSANEDLALAYAQMTSLSGDPLVDALLDLLVSTATRVQAELDGTSTEPCFAAQVARGLLENGGIHELEMAVVARLLALEWDIDSLHAIALFESWADEG